MVAPPVLFGEVSGQGELAAHFPCKFRRLVSQTIDRSEELPFSARTSAPYFPRRTQPSPLAPTAAAPVRPQRCKGSRNYATQDASHRDHTQLTSPTRLGLDRLAKLAAEAREGRGSEQRFSSTAALIRGSRILSRTAIAILGDVACGV